MVDLKVMLKLILLLALKVTTPGEMACLGYTLDFIAPMDLYIAGVELEGTAVLATQGEVVYLNGPRVSSLKVGEIGRVVRPEGRVRDPKTGAELAIYYRQLGTVQIEEVNKEFATARVLLSCYGMIKGDLVMSDIQKPAVEFNGDMSKENTPIPEQGLVSSILLGKNDAREIASGHFCFIGVGSRDGVKPGDRFTVFRPQPRYNTDEKKVEDKPSNTSYTSVRGWTYQQRQDAILINRKLPPLVLGDIVVVDAGDKVSAAKVINSISEIHLGDLVVKR
jgi:hypothetical protein